MLRMGRKNTKSTPRPPSQEAKPVKREQFNIRMPDALRAQLEVLAARNLTDVSAEIIAACLDRLKANSLWPQQQCSKETS
jgi:hypothetical protein